jgi:pilus assembly protein CpaC
MYAVFEHLENFKFFKEFRAGDVTMEHWDTPRDLGDRIKRAISFLYY